MKEFISRHAKYLVPVATAGILSLGLLGSALAAPPTPDAAAKQGIFGTVTIKGDKSLTVTTNQGEKVVLAIKDDTQFRTPGKAELSFASLAQGSRVAVLAEGPVGAQNALNVLVIASEPQREHRVLTVIETAGKTLVAEDAQGHKITVELDHEASADIKWQLITFIGVKSAQSDRFKANAEVKIEHLLKQLEATARNCRRRPGELAMPKARPRRKGTWLVCGPAWKPTCSIT